MPPSVSDKRAKISARLPIVLLAAIDQFREDWQREWRKPISRSEALVKLVERGLTATGADIDPADRSHAIDAIGAALCGAEAGRVECPDCRKLMRQSRHLALVPIPSGHHVTVHNR